MANNSSWVLEELKEYLKKEIILKKDSIKEKDILESIYQKVFELEDQ